MQTFTIHSLMRQKARKIRAKKKKMEVIKDEYLKY